MGSIRNGLKRVTAVTASQPEGVPASEGILLKTKRVKGLWRPPFPFLYNLSKVTVLVGRRAVSKESPLVGGAFDMKP